MMNTASKIDPSTLGWVKTEIDETLKQARLALEAYAENPADSGQLRFCVTYLHQVVGTLQMVELDGAALLARETEALAEAVFSNKAPAEHPTFELLTRGILSLPDYLARLQFGQADTPLRLLPLINELRAAYRGVPLAELELFHPDLSVRAPRAGSKSELSEAEFKNAVKKTRHKFQAALLKWLRAPQDKQGLTTMATALGDLEQLTSLGVVEQLLWVSSGLLAALVSGDLEPTPVRKKLLARLEQQIKRLSDGTEKAVVRNSSESLIKSILYQLATTQSNEDKVMELKRAFDLDSLVGNVSDSVDVQDLPTPEVVESVAQALGKEIDTAQELLSAYFDSGREDVSTLAPLIALLEKMSSTLLMLGVPLLKTLVDELIATSNAIMDQRVVGSEAMSMQMAGALLLMENSAHEMHASAASWKKQVEERTAALAAMRSGDAGPTIDGMEITDASLTESEFKQLLKVVAAEIRVNLAKVEEALEAFAAHSDETAHIEHTPQHLSQIQGALQILGQGRAAELTALTHGYLEDIHAKTLLPDHNVFDALAIAVGTIEVYLEGLERDRPNLDSLIDAAERELKDTIGVRATPLKSLDVVVDRAVANLNIWLQDKSDSAALAATQSALRDIGEIARAAALESVEHISREMSNLLDIVREDPSQLNDEIHTTLMTSGEILEGLAREHRAAQAAARPAPSAPPTPIAPPKAAAPASAGTGIEDLDEEIMQIFIEDAREVYQTIEKSLQAWQENFDNKEALLELRRGYHTLKGSGRMVGASEIAELAWSVENMLNQIREGVRQPNAAVFELLHEVKAALPGLIAHLEGGAAPDVDTAQLRARADALAQGEEAPTSTEADVGVYESDASLLAGIAGDAIPEFEITDRTEFAVPQVQQTRGAYDPDASDSEAPPILDVTLLQIFTAEASGHVATIRDFADAGAGELVTHSLLRSAHTLQGNARSLSLMPMAAACQEMEKYLQNLELRQMPVDRPGIDALTRIMGQVGELLERMNEGHGLTAALKQGFAEATQTFSGLIEQLNHESAAPFDSEAESVPTDRVAFIPPPAPPAASVEEIVEEIDPELLEIFHEEAVDILESIEEALAQWRSNRSDRGAVQGLKRALHTLKGGARMAGAMTMGNISHNTESLLRQVEDGRVSADSALLDLLDEVHDSLAEMLKQLERHQPFSGAANTLNNKVLAYINGDKTNSDSAAITAPAVRPAPTLKLVATEDEASLAVPTPTFAAPEDIDAPLADTAYTLSASAASATSVTDEDAEANGDDDAEAGVDRKERREHIKVRTGLLNELVNYAGEVSISRSRMEQQIFGLREHLSELNGNVTRFREQIRELEIQSESQILYRAGDTSVVSQHPDFDPLEFDRFSKLQQVSRSLSESVHDLSTLQNTLDNFVGEAETVLQQQARVNTDLQEGLMRTRMINFSTQAARLRHIVRQTSRELGKRAELQIAGTEVEVDRNVLERMIGPFEHMIRNALDHGLEDEAERRRLHKPATGKITIQTSHEGSEIVIRFSDDGAGLNIAAIRKKAVERGLAKANVNLADDEVMQFILLPGFSTAQKITHFSGRGVGMDVVHNEVKQLGGSITVDTQAGIGTTFIVRLPLTLSIAQALMVYVGEQLFAIPLNSIANILEVPVDKLNQISMGERPLLNYEDQVYPFMHLGTRLGINSNTKGARKVPVLVAKSGARHIAIQIDGLAGTREVVIKSLGPQLTQIKGLAGATILGDGKVVLILDVGGLWITDSGMQVLHTQQEPEAPVARHRPLVMVVDDSLTVRKVTSRHLQKRGMDVLIAKDGLDAWEQLREHTPDVMLVDIEMPRMDGYELTANIRSSKNLKHIPIIMITSRAGTKHRDRAMQLGVNLYMSKPYQEDELMRNIDSMLALPVG